MQKIFSKNQKYTWFLIILLLGFVLRLLMPFFGYNVDAGAWWLVSWIQRSGGNVYAETPSYNYGPIWALTLEFLGHINIFNASSELESFRWNVTSFLACIDIGIFIILYSNYGLIKSSLFYLSPISIIISGYQIQFDNFAILCGFISVIILQRSKSNTKFFLFGLFMLGISMCIKHILFFFPVWLFISERLLVRKILSLFIPYFIFLVSFLFYLPQGLQGIINNVFLYRSWLHNAPFWKLFAPSFLASKEFMHFPLFIISLLIFGLLVKNKKILDKFTFYLIAVVLFSSAIANHYLAIPTPSIALNFNFGYSLYTIFSSIHLFFDKDALHIPFMGRQIGQAGQHYYLPIFFLTLGLYIQVFGKKGLSHLKNRFIQLKKWIFVQIKEQLINAHK